MRNLSCFPGYVSAASVLSVSRKPIVIIDRAHLVGSGNDICCGACAYVRHLVNSSCWGALSADGRHSVAYLPDAQAHLSPAVHHSAAGAYGAEPLYAPQGADTVRRRVPLLSSPRSPYVPCGLPYTRAEYWIMPSRFSAPRRQAPRSPPIRPGTAELPPMGVDGDR